MKIAFAFPGQGSQYIGMGKNFFDESPLAQQFFKTADETLGFSLSKLCFEGPEEELKKTAITQPAIFTVSAIAYEMLKEKGIKPDYVLGHSLGEYSAIYAAGAISFADAVKLVNMRGKFMQEASPEGSGKMAAILGMDYRSVIEICQLSSNGSIVQPANINSPEQVVISGDADAVESASKECLAQGAKRAIELPVSAPFHSALMQPAADKLQEEINKIEFKDAVIPVITNVTALPINKAEDIKNSLVEQVCSPVLWVDSVKTLADLGVETVIEVGPGKVLTGLNKKINRELKLFNVEDMKSLEGVNI